MNDQAHPTADLHRLYARAFDEFGTMALWNKQQHVKPTPDDALVVARALRREGDMSARKLAEDIEAAANAAD